MLINCQPDRRDPNDQNQRALRQSHPAPRRKAARRSAPAAADALTRRRPSGQALALSGVPVHFAAPAVRHTGFGLRKTGRTLPDQQPLLFQHCAETERAVHPHAGKTVPRTEEDAQPAAPSPGRGPSPPLFLSPSGLPAVRRPAARAAPAPLRALRAAPVLAGVRAGRAVPAGQGAVAPGRQMARGVSNKPCRTQ